jgi:hypothetical protein
VNPTGHGLSARHARQRPAGLREATRRRWAAPREAVEHYRRSIAIHPTAEAPRFSAGRSLLGHPDEAIAECRTAIDVDPAFGNPYNDIGAYLIELGREAESITCL